MALTLAEGLREARNIPAFNGESGYHISNFLRDINLILSLDNKSSVVRDLLAKTTLTTKGPSELPIYSHLKDAIPYIRQGSYAFHCEVVDAYPEIAKSFDMSEICDLRVVSGLLNPEIVNSVVTKNSVFTELFRIIMIRASECGIIRRLLNEKQPKKPQCQNLYTVFPVSISATSSSLMLLAAVKSSNLRNLISLPVRTLEILLFSSPLPIDLLLLVSIETLLKVVMDRLRPCESWENVEFPKECLRVVTLCYD
ncbi:uncharacterized protein LOC142224818 [Haematobia irritans]|uniref:uncharacterized protein LOC142224818 n=1 Tax=Haematobia irritans TaxID=7368 RepID=UPI003F4F6AF0